MLSTLSRKSPGASRRSPTISPLSWRSRTSAQHGALSVPGKIRGQAEKRHRPVGEIADRGAADHAELRRGSREVCGAGNFERGRRESEIGEEFSETERFQQLLRVDRAVRLEISLLSCACVQLACAAKPPVASSIRTGVRSSLRSPHSAVRQRSFRSRRRRAGSLAVQRRFDARRPCAARSPANFTCNEADRRRN